jgi:hypothetical protein
MSSIEHTVIYQPFPQLPQWIRLTTPRPERRDSPPEERGPIGKWLRLADVALDRTTQTKRS